MRDSIPPPPTSIGGYLNIRMIENTPSPSNIAPMIIGCFLTKKKAVTSTSRAIDNIIMSSRSK